MTLYWLEKGAGASRHPTIGRAISAAVRLPARTRFLNFFGNSRALMQCLPPLHHLLFSPPSSPPCSKLHSAFLFMLTCSTLDRDVILHQRFGNWTGEVRDVFSDVAGNERHNILTQWVPLRLTGPSVLSTRGYTISRLPVEWAAGLTYVQ